MLLHGPGTFKRSELWCHCVSNAMYMVTCHIWQGETRYFHVFSL